MVLPKTYVRDRVILLLLSINAFLVLLMLLTLLLRLGDASGNYIVQYRATYGVNNFRPGKLVDLLSFGVFALVVFGVNFVMSARTYRIHRQLAVVILSIGALLLVFSLIVSNALLVLR
ncbi:hypothetical protein KDA23_01570 [Candidatus Saccharibacteria bacterium]|nr:hypothetical protein [Candidatus Saccharibacteria bacterium]